jgi:hypothetical protein
MIIASSRYFNILVCHSDVFCIDLQIVWGSHDDELDGPFISESFICP